VSQVKEDVVLRETHSSNEAVSGSPGSTSKCYWPLRAVAPPHSVAISMNALAADIVPSPTTRALWGVFSNGEWHRKKGVLYTKPRPFDSPLRLDLQKGEQFVRRSELALAKTWRHDRLDSL
jgi:hypothetical protein